MSSFSIPLTGLESSTTALNTIANNLANMNTTRLQEPGRELQRSVLPADRRVRLRQSARSGSRHAGGFDFDRFHRRQHQLHRQPGRYGHRRHHRAWFFVVQDGNNAEYTRDGSFTVSSTGNLTTAGGLNVMGYPVVNGAVDTNAPLAPIQLPVNQSEQRRRPRRICRLPPTWTPRQRWEQPCPPRSSCMIRWAIRRRRR